MNFSGLCHGVHHHLSPFAEDVPSVSNHQIFKIFVFWPEPMKPQLIKAYKAWIVSNDEISGFLATIPANYHNPFQRALLKMIWLNPWPTGLDFWGILGYPPGWFMWCLGWFCRHSGGVSSSSRGKFGSLWLQGTEADSWIQGTFSFRGA